MFSLLPDLVEVCFPRVVGAFRVVLLLLLLLVVVEAAAVVVGREGLVIGLEDTRTGREPAFFIRVSGLTFSFSACACLLCDLGFLGAGPASSAEDSGRGATAAPVR